MPKTAKSLLILSANVDELGALERELTPFRFKIARLDALKKSIRQHYADEEAGAFFMASGEKFAVSVGAQSREAHVSMWDLRRAIGPKLFLQIITVTQKRLAEEVPAAIIEKVTSYTLTGFRPLKVFERGSL